LFDLCLKVILIFNVSVVCVDFVNDYLVFLCETFLLIHLFICIGINVMYY